MKKLISNLFIVLVAILGATVIIKCQKAQRTSKIEPEVLGMGEHKAVYYEYQAYLRGGE